MKHSNQHYIKHSLKKGSPSSNSLRQRMIEDMILHNQAKSTQENYVSGVRRLSRYYKRSPDKITESQVRSYILFLKEQSGLSFDTIRVIYYGIKFFYQKTMGWNWKIFDIIRVPQPKHLPTVLSYEEVKKVLSYVRHPISAGSVRSAFLDACKKAKIKKKGSINPLTPGLRHNG